MSYYKTAQNQARVEQIIDKSRFIAHVAPVSSKEEAEAFIGDIRSQYKDATHNVPAMVIGDKFQIQWASDDGEPQGTSGAPMAQMLVAKGITNVVIVVTRYFGGVKLGPGGLVRAYTSTAKLGLEEAGIVEVVEKEFFYVKFGYPFLDKFQHLASQENFKVEELAYSDSILGTFSTPPENSENMVNIINNITNGTGKIIERKIRETR